MNDNIIMQINKCVENATAFKESAMYQEFNYYKGQLVGLGLACKTFGFADEAAVAIRLSKKYPFEGKKPIDGKKILGLGEA